MTDDITAFRLETGVPRGGELAVTIHRFPSPPDRIAELEAQLRQVTAERDMYKSLCAQRVNHDNAMRSAARKWRAIKALLAEDDRP